MSHTISLSLRADPPSFGRQGKEEEVKGRGFGEGSNCMVSDSVFVLVFSLNPK